MSSTNRGGNRANLDFYATPAEAVDPVLDVLLARGDITAAAEPAAGDGAIVERLLARGIYVIATEIDSGRAARCYERTGVLPIARDALTEPPPLPRPSLAITNPPFVLADAFARRCLEIADTTALLLRLNWAAGVKRAAWHRAHPAEAMVLSRRPKFAASLQCRGCDWRALVAVEDETRVCPVCGSKVRRTVGDSCEYAWFVWGRLAHPGTWRVL